MEEINLWEMGTEVHVKLKPDFLHTINVQINKKFRSKEKAYSAIGVFELPCSTFRNILKYSYYRGGYYAPLSVFLQLCDALSISRFQLQDNIEAYKTPHGYNVVENPILPIKITPVFDMILAHNIADGTVIRSKGRLPYFGYRQFNRNLRVAYVRKLESIFGKIKFKEDYFETTTRPYCPAVLAALFFKLYRLNDASFLSTKARLPGELMNKNWKHLLAVLLGFIIDEGAIDSTLICIRLKNIALCNQLYVICNKLGYASSFSSKDAYGTVNILKHGMVDLFADYERLLEEYPSISLYHLADKIKSRFNFHMRRIYKTKGNQDIILKLIQGESLTVNQLGQKINMTRQGVRFHVHNLEKNKLIRRNGFIGKKNIVYTINNGGS